MQDEFVTQKTGLACFLSAVTAVDSYFNEVTFVLNPSVSCLLHLGPVLRLC